MTRAQPRANGKLATRLTRKIVDEIAVHLSEGASLPGSAALAGVPARTFWQWVARGKNGSGTKLERELAFVIEMANDAIEGEGGKRLWNADDWRAWLAFLERRFPERWSPPEKRVQHGGQVGLYAAITRERLREALIAGEISDVDAEVFARVWRVLSGREVAGEIVAGEALEIEAGEAA